MKNNWALEDYKLIQDKNDKIWPYMLVLLFITIGIIIILCKFNFQLYEKQTLIKNDNSYILIVDSTKIEELKSNSNIYINKKRYKYNIEKISQDYSNVNGIIYQTIHINPYNYKTEAIITDCYFLKSKKTIIEMLFEFIEGGIK